VSPEDQGAQGPAPRDPHPAPPRPDGILRNITWLGIGSAAVSPLWFFFISYLCIRNLSPDAYGLMNWALWLMIIAASVTDLGLNDYVTREVARRRDQAWRYFSNFLVFRGGLGLIVMISVIAIASALGASDERLTALGLAGVYGLSVFLIGFCRVFFRAFHVLRYESISVMLEKILVLTGGSIMLLSTGTATGTLMGMTVGMLFAVMGTFWFVAFRIAPFEFSVLSTSFLKQNLRVAAPLGVFAIAVIAYMRMGPVILDFFEGSAEVGRFGAAFRIVEAMLLLPALATAALLPRMSASWGQGNHADFRRVVLSGVTGMLIVSGLLGLGLGIGGSAILDFIATDPEYEGAGRMLQWLGLAYPVMCLNSVLSISLIAADGQRFLGQFMASVTGAISILFVLAIWQYGTAGLLVVFIGGSFATTLGLWARFRVVAAPQ
jgi:O-antigen/teichoic acid export membrane protein